MGGYPIVSAPPQAQIGAASIGLERPQRVST
jgi:hypothetical protein